MNKVLFSSKSSEWETPQDLFDTLNKEFKFTLDPAATKENAKCKKFYTIKENGLKQDWRKETIFLNPPYGRGVGVWVEKCSIASEDGAVVVALLPARTDTQWWHSYVERYAIEIRFLPGRLRFVGGKYPAPFPSVIVIFGSWTDNGSGWSKSKT